MRFNRGVCENFTPRLDHSTNLGADIFGDKYDLRASPNHLVLRRIWPSSNQRKNRRAIRRRDRHPALTGLQPCIERQMKPQLIQIESQAAVLVANIHVDAVHPQIQIPPRRGGETTHRRNYKSDHTRWKQELTDNDSAASSIRSDHPAMIERIILVTTLAFPASFFGDPPWDKAPEKWDHADAYRILQDSPWSPAQVKLDTKSTTHYTDRQTGRVDDSCLIAI